MSWQLGLRSVGCRNRLSQFPKQAWNRIFASRFSDKSNPSDIKDDDRLVERKPLSGYVYDEGIDGYKSKWRIPFLERKSFWKSKLGAFSSKKFQATTTRLNPENLRFVNIKNWWNKEKVEKLVYDQRFIEERLIVLGCDLAAAHFAVYRGGAIKFKGQNKWIRDDKSKSEYDVDLPNKYDPNYVVEAIDFSNTNIVYEGLKNIENLTSLKWLSFANCLYFDDWCLDRISGEHRNNLEYLDISFTKVTHRGLHSLYRFNKLKSLKVDELNDDPLFFQTCLEFQSEFKGLDVELATSKTLTNEQHFGPSSSVSQVEG